MEKNLLTVNETYTTLVDNNHLTNKGKGVTLERVRARDDARPTLEDIHDAFVYYFNKDSGEDVALSTGGDDESEVPPGYLYNKAKFIRIDKLRARDNVYTVLTPGDQMGVPQEDKYGEISGFYKEIFGEDDMGFDFVEIFSLFTDSEKHFIKERVNGINRDRSALPDRVYRKCMKSVREKIVNSMMEKHA